MPSSAPAIRSWPGATRQRGCKGSLIARAPIPLGFTSISTAPSAWPWEYPVSEVFNTLQVYLGSYYVNNFNEFGRTWQVNIQADEDFREHARDIKQLKVRNNRGEMVRLGTLLELRSISGPVMVMRYNMYSATAITGNTAPGTSSGQAIALCKRLPGRNCHGPWRATGRSSPSCKTRRVRRRFSSSPWPSRSYSWCWPPSMRAGRLPMAVILVVPMCLFCSLAGLNLAGMEVNIFTQIGFVVLVGLASKNAILIVEFAKQRQDEGIDVRTATLQACQLRLRPILMTSFAFIFGVLPLVFAFGAGAEMRHALGLAVFCGMLGVTFFGIFLTPVFFYAIRRNYVPTLPQDKPSPHDPNGTGWEGHGSAASQ